MKKLLLFLAVSIILVNQSYSQLELKTGITGGSYAEMANDIKKISSQPVVLESSFGGRDNYFDIRNNVVDVSFLQYDILDYQTVTNEDLGDKVRAIRILLPLGYEEIHIITLADSDIDSFNDLAGKKIGIGDKYQGTMITASYINDLTGMKWKPVVVSVEEASKWLISGKIDAFLFVGSAPVKRFNNSRDSIFKLIPINEKSLADVYTPVTIKSQTYLWQKKDVSTYAVRFALVTNTSEMDEEKAKSLKTLLNDIYTNIEVLKKEGHPMWNQVDFYLGRTNWPVFNYSKELFVKENQK